jgi:amidophosphoribosyltransferase
LGGFFGVAAKGDCVPDLFYGIDYHSHLGTMRGGMAVKDGSRIKRFIHNITNAQFRSKFDPDLPQMAGNLGIGIISDSDDQPLLIGSHLGNYAIVTVGKINNANELIHEAFRQRSAHFAEMGGSEINPTELVATLINREGSFVRGIQQSQNRIDGSCSILLMTDEGIYAARDKFGRTPIVIGKKSGSFAATMETCALPNLDYQVERYLGPGEIVLLKADGWQVVKKPGEKMRICAFLWVYFGFPASSYEGINVEACRYRNGELLAMDDHVEVDMVAGVPDSGTGHAIGYANQAGIARGRPFVKYTPTWPRSFMPQSQSVRDLVAKMKLIPIQELIEGKRLLFCDDSIVRGTQLRDTIQRLYDAGAKEIHIRPACPPLVYGCKFLNFSRSRSVLDLATRRAIKELEGKDDLHLQEYSNPDSARYRRMVEAIRKNLNVTTLKFQRLDKLVQAIGLPKERICTYCWDCQGDCRV